MTNIIKKETESNMHSHNDIIEFLNDYLKYGYTKEAKKRLALKGIEMESSMIRNIKSGYTENWKVLEVLAEIATENKNSQEKTKALISNN